MNTQTFNYLYSNLGLDTGNLKVLYNFESYAEGQQNILSSQRGQPFYSGTVHGNFDSFTGSVSGSGYFNDNHIRINDSSGLFSTACSFVFSQQKVDNSAGTIFSNYSGGSGFEFGINNANKLYFKSNYLTIPYIKTLNNIPSEKNVYAVTLNGSSLNLARYIPYTNTLDAEEFAIQPISITDTKNWIIGSGEYGYKGYLDNFIYASQFLPRAKIRALGRAFSKEAYLKPATIETLSGAITGYEKIFSGISGQVGSLTGVTGYLTGSGAFSYESGIPLTGCVEESGAVYIPFGTSSYSYPYEYLSRRFYETVCMGVSGSQSSYSGATYFFDGSSGVFEGKTGYCSAGNFFGITGFDVVTLSGSFTGTTPLIGVTGDISGVIRQNVTLSGLRAPNVTYTGTAPYVDFSGQSIKSFYPNSYVYTENRQPKYFVESIGLNSGDYINKKTRGALAPSSKITFMLDSSYNPNGLNIAFNGISLLSGRSSAIRNQVNQMEVTVDQGYFITGKMELFAGLPITRKDEAIYDIQQLEPGKRTHLIITGTGQYTEAPFSEINITGTQVFFNGVKIYSGVDYHERDGAFLPTGDLLEITGTYFTYPDYAGIVGVTTGEGLGGYFDLESSKPFVPNAHVFYINGIRQDPAVFIEHSSGVDLLETGRQTFKRYFNEIYMTQRYDI